MQINRSIISKLRKAFDSYNTARIYNATGNFSDLEEALFNVVPILLHHNAKIDSLQFPITSPRGIRFFNPLKIQLEAFARLFPSTSLKETKCDSNSPILSLALMGSIGTVAQSEKSDFDYVLFMHRDSLSKKQLEDFQIKLTAIEVWAQKRMSTEVHFFIEDIKCFKENRFGIGRIDGESVGTAVKRLFKDEFYRTAIFIAGNRPLWWIIPPGLAENEAGEFKKLLPDLIGEETKVYLDLGHVINIDPQEFFGAALWQMNKLLNSPFKSLLKMGLLESYLEDPDSGLLCESLKQKVLKSREAGYDIDPYIMMCNRVSNYYSDCGMWKEARLLQGSFLMKTGMAKEDIDELLKPPQEKWNDKQKTMARLLRSWKWEKEDTALLERYLLGTVKSYKSSDSVSKFFLNIYVRLSDWLRKSGITNTLISKKDMTVLGRRLFAYFERKPGKIPFIPPGLLPGKPPQTVSLVFNKEFNRNGEWSFFDFPITGIDIVTLKNVHLPLMEFKNIVEMLSWLVVNRFWTPKSSLHFEAGSSSFNAKDVKYILAELFHFFVEKQDMETQKEDYLTSRRAIKSFNILNFGLEDIPSQVHRVDMLILDSWGDLVYKQIRPQDAFKETAEMLIFSEKKNKPFSFKVVFPPSQNDPGLCDEFENGVNKAKEQLVPKRLNIQKKKKLDNYPRYSKTKLDL